LAAIYYSKQSGFEIIHGFLDRIMQLLNVKFSKDGTGYWIEKHDGTSVLTRSDLCSDATFFDGRCAQIRGPNGIVLGVLGVLHPQVITAFGLTLPCSAVEMSIEPFL
jgi:phenylalanyl-tRNA synthetase beta chain